MIKFKLKLLILFVDIFAVNCIKINKNDVDNLFKSSQIITPQIKFLGNSTITSTNNEDDQNSNLYPKKVLLQFDLPRKNNVIANLNLNNHLQGHFIQIQKYNGSELIKYDDNHELCQYRGTIQGQPKSDVIVSLCGNKINGVIFDKSGTYYIQSKVNNSEIKHYLIKDSDVSGKIKCDLNTTNPDHNPNTSIISPRNRNRRSIDAVRGPYNANLKSLFIELVLVVDNSLYNSFNRDIKSIHQYCKGLINIVNAFYSPLNIHVALIGIVIWSERDEIRITSNSVETLKNFLDYRRTKLLPTIPNDSAVLLTNKAFDYSVTGKAFLGTMCTASLSGAVISKHSPIIAVVASTIAHEIGHTLGMSHDEDIPNCYCPQNNCMMSQTVNEDDSTNEWSHCSQASLSKALTSGLNYCLKNKPIKLFKSSSCGNGFVEPGEECDCGLPKYCKSKCCNPKTCRLHDRAVCATGECCDLNSCKLKKPKTPCRLSLNECDTTEYCDGRSEYCPENSFKPDASNCENGLSYCFKGKCGSRQQQCQKLWGPNAVSIKECYNQNLQGSHHGNCGFDRKSNQFKKCAHENIQCGALLCTHRIPNNHLKEDPRMYPSNHIMFGGSWVHDSHLSPRLCHAADFDISSAELNLGLTPNGAKCGNNKICVNQTCIDIYTIREPFKPSCPGNCFNNGVCNQDGTCTCDELFAPPFCADYDDSYYDIEGIVPDVKIVQRIKSCQQNCTGNRFCGPRGICRCKKGFSGSNCLERSIDTNNYTKIILYVCLALLLLILIAVGVYFSKNRNSAESQNSRPSIYKRSLSKIEGLLDNIKRKPPMLIPKK